MIWILPLTTQGHDNKYYFSLKNRSVESWVVLSQLRILSSNRLLRKMDNVSEEEFNNILLSIVNMLKIEIPLAGEISEAEAHSD